MLVVNEHAERGSSLLKIELKLPPLSISLLPLLLLLLPFFPHLLLKETRNDWREIEREREGKGGREGGGAGRGRGRGANGRAKSFSCGRQGTSAKGRRPGSCSRPSRSSAPRTTSARTWSWRPAWAAGCSSPGLASAP